MKRVIIVDDKDDNRYYLRVLLAASEFDVREARHGAEALLLARAEPPDLIVSDLLMPVMDGYTLLQQSKADPRLRQTRFVVYTATYTEESDARLALDLGADAFIVKPSEPDVLLDRIRSVLTAGNNSVKPVLATESPDVLEAYSSTLVRKLEEKSLQLAEANRQLEHSAAWLEMAGRVARLGGWGLDLKTEQVYWSDEVCRIHEEPEGFVPDLDRGMSYYAPTSRPKIALAVSRCAEHGTPFDLELELDTARGRRIFVRAIGHAIRDEQQRIVRLQGAFQDLTDLKRAQEERQRLEQQFLRAQRLESIGTLAGGIAHDLNNVLSPVLLSIDLLRDIAGPDHATLIDTLHNNVKRGADLVRQVLTFARGLDGKREPVDLRDVVREIEMVIRESFPRNIDLRVELPAVRCVVRGDATQVHQVLMNLVVNARDAMRGGGLLQVRVEDRLVDVASAAALGVEQGPYLALVVEDSGSGISGEVQQSIFEPFFTTKPVGEGTGLGLSTVMAIMRGHHGAVTLESEPGRGASFTCLFPMLQSVQRVRTPLAVSAVSSSVSGECVLLVDDEPAILAVARRILERQGYRVHTASGGKEGIAMFRELGSEISIVITDLAMPDLDGIAVVRAVREVRADIPVVIATGYLDEDDAAHVAEVRIDQLLYKPFTAEALLSALRNSLTRSQQAPHG